jgi:membrane protein
MAAAGGGRFGGIVIGVAGGRGDSSPHASADLPARGPVAAPVMSSAGDEQRLSTREREGAPQPQPEHEEPTLQDPTPTELSLRDYRAIVVRAGKEALDDHITNLAAAIAYYSFLAVPSLLLVAVGAFSLFAGPDAIATITEKLAGVVPREALTLIDESLTRVTENRANSGIAMAVVGTVLAVWSLTGAMQTLMWALNSAYERDETRGFVKRRLTALLMVVLMLFAFALAFGLLVLGPHLSGWIGDAVGLEALVAWLWWTAQWPVLILGLLVAFATILYLGPDVDHPRWQFLTFGTVLAVFVWLLGSGAFAVYVSQFGSYNKAWGSVATVIVMLIWLWLSALALLFGAELNAEAERSRELRRGEPAEVELQAPPRG